jgi:hypothetical protein
MAPNWSREKGSGTAPRGLYFFGCSISACHRVITEKVERGVVPDSFDG